MQIIEKCLHEQLETVVIHLSDGERVTPLRCIKCGLDFDEKEILRTGRLP